MNKNNFLITVLMILLGFAFSSSAQEVKKETSDFPKLTGDYFGQKLPGSVPEVFAPGIVSTKDMAHSPLAISKDGNDIAWFVLDNVNTPPQDKIFYTRKINGVWHKPKYILRNIDEVIYHMYFTNDSELVCMSFKYNTADKTYFKATNTFKQSDKGWHNPTVSKFEPLDSPGSFFESDDFIIYDAEQQSGNGWLDLFIKFRKQDGSLSEAINMGKSINSKWNEHYPSLSPDGKYFFFVRSGNYYWVESDFIDELKKKY